MSQPSRIIGVLAGALVCLALAATPALARPIEPMNPIPHKTGTYHRPLPPNMPHWPRHPQPLAPPAAAHHDNGGSHVPVIPIVAAVAGLVVLGGGVYAVRARPRASRAGAPA